MPHVTDILLKCKDTTRVEKLDEHVFSFGSSFKMTTPSLIDGILDASYASYLNWPIGQKRMLNHWKWIIFRTNLKDLYYVVLKIPMHVIRW